MAFLVFPAEVWEVILENLIGSEDVLNTFRAYPELEAQGVLKTKRHLWLFDQVIPLLVRWLNKKEMFFCRQVCKQWCHGVDNFLENHPAHFKGLDIGISNAGAFYRELLAHPRERNPFLGRYLGFWEYDSGPDVTARWKEALDFTRELGDKIWFLRLEPGPIYDIISFCRLTLKFLESTPNLKAFRLNSEWKTICYVDDLAEQKEKARLEMAKVYLTTRKAGFPSLPQLKTLEFIEAGDIPPFMVNFLIEAYGKQIRKLSLHISFWEKEIGEWLPNLTEFTLFGTASKAEVVDLLRALNSPKLWRLQLSDIEGRFIDLNEIIDALKPFIHLQILSTRCNSTFFTWSPPIVKEGEEPFGGIASIPGLKSLSLEQASQVLSGT